ncbi:MAG TPA: enoyl-CoA hydratase-related protein [Desulfatiglandales bacterium]
MGDDLLYEVKDRVAYMTINRESRRNALSQEMIAAFLDDLDQADQDEEVRAVCITGAGDRVFCSGADLVVAFADQGGDRLIGARKYAQLLKSMAKFGKPLLARVNGTCVAGGLGLILSCDIVLARNDVHFFTPEVNVGIFPMMIGVLLYRNMPRKKVMDMVLTGRRVPAVEAEKIGLITRAVDPERLDQAVQETLRLLTSKSPIAIRLGKEAFRAMSDMPFDEAVDYLCEALGKALSTEDAMEGMMAFMEKREPKFKGK